MIGSVGERPTAEGAASLPGREILYAQGSVSKALYGDSDFQSAAFSDRTTREFTKSGAVASRVTTRLVYCGECSGVCLLMAAVLGHEAMGLSAAGSTTQIGIPGLTSRSVDFAVRVYCQRTFIKFSHQAPFVRSGWFRSSDRLTRNGEPSL